MNKEEFINVGINYLNNCMNSLKEAEFFKQFSFPKWGPNLTKLWTQKLEIIWNKIRVNI